MKLSLICIRRPVLAWVLTLIVLLTGLICFSRLSLQQYPSVTKPYVTIETDLPGAGPEVVEIQVTRVIEDAVSNIEGVISITSNSSSEKSQVGVEFKPERKMDEATNDIRDRLSKVKDKLPQEATDPLLTKSRIEEKAVITLALTSQKLNPTELNDLAQRDLVKDLEACPGVARVDVMGASDFVMKIYLKPDLMSAYGVSVVEVVNALKKQNFEKPAGRIVTKNKEYLVTTVASLEKPEEFERLVVSSKEGSLVRLSQIGRAEVTDDNRKTKTRFNGKRCLTLGIVKQSNANPLQISEDVQKFVKRVKTFLPNSVFLDIASDRTTFIKNSLEQVFKTIVEATLLVILVVVAFLRSLRASIIPLVTIPVSLIGTLSLMYLLNFSINSLTLMAMVLGIGLVVDDAIVVLENIYRYMEKGMKAFQAAFTGIQEISFAVIAMTLTLAAVYTPISFAQGVIGKMLTEFAITLSGAVIISGFVALTLSPMMCARMLQMHKKSVSEAEISHQKGWIRFKSLFLSDIWLIKIEQTYQKFLQRVLKKRLWTIAVGIVFAGLGGVIYNYLPSELTPKEDQGFIMIEGHSPLSATLGYTESYVEKIDRFLSNMEDIETRVTQINNPSFDISVTLKKDRKMSTDEIGGEIKKFLHTLTGLEAKIRSTGEEESRVVQFVVRGNKSHRELSEIVTHLVSLKLYATQIMGPISAMTRQESSDFLVTILREKILALNIEPYTVAETIDALIRGAQAKTFKMNNQMYRVWVEVEDADRQSPDDINKLFVKSNDKEGTLVPMAELVDIKNRTSPVEIYRKNRMRAVQVYAFMKPGYSLGDGVKKVQELSPDLKDVDVRIDFVDETLRFLTEGNMMKFVFLLAIFFIYLVMAAQFESWRDPFIILLSVPLSLAGAVMTLFVIEGGSLNLYSNVGLITLVGLITKHGILMVDFANQMREQRGLGIQEAIIESCVLRLRPILMTTLAMVLGAIPLAMATGAGSEARRQLGWVIVGGMSIGTLFTLFVVPAFYTYLASTHLKKKEVFVEG
jgi:multidrug efflux pump